MGKLKIKKEKKFNKNVRILLIDNSITALFMISWLKQNNLHNDKNWHTISFYCTTYCATDSNETYSQNTEEKQLLHKKLLHEDTCKKILSVIPTEWISCAGPPSFEDSFSLTPFSLKKTFAERKRKKIYINKIITSLKTTNISLSNIKEVLYGTSGFGAYFRYLCPQAKLLKFEHGLGDVIVRFPPPLFPKNLPFIKKYKRKLYWWIYRRLVFFNFSYLNFEFNSCFSLLGQERKAISKNYVLKIIDSSSVLDSLNQIKKQFDFKKLTDISGGNSALILLPNIKPFVQGNHDYKHFFQALENCIVTHYLQIFETHNIKNILFKSRFFHEESNKCYDFQQLKKHFNIFFLSDYSENNLPVEFYIDTINPTILIGSYSSGLFYSKKLYPYIKTYSYHRWFIDYITQVFHKTFPEIGWAEKTFHGTLKESFAPLLPQIIPQNK